jgi:hypothetical protein
MVSYQQPHTVIYVCRSCGKREGPFTKDDDFGEWIPKRIYDEGFVLYCDKECQQTQEEGFYKDESPLDWPYFWVRIENYLYQLEHEYSPDYAIERTEATRDDYNIDG